MYEAYWGLREKPFENVPDPRFLFRSAEHEEALARLRYAVTARKGAAMLTGDYGSGKTLLSRVLRRELRDDARYQLALITYPKLTGTQFLRELLYQLTGAEPRGDKTRVLHALQRHLEENAERDLDTVVLIDEAQTISSKVLFEEIRLLLNFQREDRFLLSLVFLGQPELKRKVDALPQLKQRLAIRYHLRNLSAQETSGYVGHRLRVAGVQRQIFSPEALLRVAGYSQGRPRGINNVCDLALVVGAGRGASVVDVELVREVISDLEGGPEA